MSKSDASGSPIVGAAIKLMDPKALIETTGVERRMRFRLLVLALAQAGYGRARVVCGHRSLDGQMVLYGYGRTARECVEAGVPNKYARPGRGRVTWVKPSESMHVRGRAIDIDFSMYAVVTWSAIGVIADMLGLMWGGNWKVRDYGHFEI